MQFHLWERLGEQREGHPVKTKPQRKTKPNKKAHACTFRHPPSSLRSYIMSHTSGITIFAPISDNPLATTSQSFTSSNSSDTNFQKQTSDLVQACVPYLLQYLCNSEPSDMCKTVLSCLLDSYFSSSLTCEV